MLRPLGSKRYLPSERVAGIWPRRVQVDLTAAELDRLPPYEEPVVETLPKAGFFKRLFG